MTADKRAKHRKSNIVKTLSMGAYSKAVSILVSFAMVPLAVNYLGTGGYGLWVAVSSLIALLSFTDGGVGKALLNMVSHATGANVKQPIRHIISSGFFVLLCISIIGASIFLMLSSYVDWAWVFGLNQEFRPTELYTLVLIVGLAFFIAMPFSLVGNVQHGFQEGNIEAFWNAKGRLLSLVFAIIAIQLDKGLFGFALAVVSGPIVAALGNNIYYFGVRNRAMIPALSSVRKDNIHAVLGTGGLFFVLQITSAIQLSADNIIISNMIGPSAVAQYAICMQLFLVIPMLMGLLWAPLWPALREAMASDDVEWVKRVFAKSLKLAFLVGLPSLIVLVIFGQDIMRIWVGDEVVPSTLLLVGCGVWMFLVLIGNVIAVFLNAMQWLKVQIIVALSAGTANVFITIFLVGKVGFEGAVYGSIISYIIFALVPYSILIPNYMRSKRFTSVA